MAITSEMRTAVLELYTAYFNRAADKDGVDYWLNEMDTNNWTIDMVAQSFADQTEYSSIYSGLTNAQIVAKIYDNVLGRTADTAGATYWEEQLDSGSFPVSQLVQAVVNAATEVDGDGNAVHSDDKAIVDNKSSVSQKMYDAGLNETSVSLATVTKETSTVDTVFQSGATTAYDNALTAYNSAVTTAAASKAAADTAALSVGTVSDANASLTAANTAKTDADAVVTAANNLATAAAATTSTTDDTTASGYVSSATTAQTTAAALVTTATAAVTAAQAAAATTVTVTSTAVLTNGIDDLKGDGSNNQFIGDATTAQVADQIDGGAGDDIFKLYDGAGTTDIPTLSNVERIELIRFTNDLDTTSIAGITHLTLDDVTTGKNYTMAGTVTSIVKNMAGGEVVDLTYGATDTTSGVYLEDFGTSATSRATLDLNGAGIATLNLSSITDKNYVVLGASPSALKTINVAGNVALDLDLETNNLTTITKVDASGMSAGGMVVELDAASTSATTITGSGYADTVTATAAVAHTVDLGAGNDLLTIGDATGEITTADTLTGGTGTDTLAVASVVASEIAASDAIQAKVTGFEQLRITNNLDDSFDISELGINYLQLADDVVNDETISGFSSGATIELRDAANMSNDLTVTMTNATDTGSTTDTLNLFLNANTVNNSAFDYDFDIAGIETVNVNAVDRDNTDGLTNEDDGYVIEFDGNSNNNSASLKTLNIEGSAEVSYTGDAGETSLATINGSTSTAELILEVGAINGVAMTITGGTKDDDIDGSQAADTINGGAGNDTLSGDAGNDIFVISSVSESKGDTIDGEGGTDTLQIKSTAVGTGGITQNLIDLTTSTNTILDNTAFTAGTPIANVEDVDASAVTNSMKIVGDGSANKITTGTGADTLKLNGGADTVVLTATNSVDGKEDSILDFTKDTDILLLTGDHGTNAIALNALTVTNNGDSASNTFQYTDLGAVDIVLQVSHTDLTDSVQLGDSTTAFTTNATTVVAGDLADNIVLGSAAQTVTLHNGADGTVNVVTIAAGGSNDGSEDTFSDFDATGTAAGGNVDKLILTGDNSSEALSLAAVSVTSNEKTLGKSHVVFTGNTDTDVTEYVQLGSTTATYKSYGNTTGGAYADTLQSTSSSSSQTMDGGAGNDVFFYDSSTTDATGTTQTITGAAGTDTIVIAGGTTAVDFSTDTINTMETLELTKTFDLTTADTNAQSVTMNDAQVDGLSTINASYNGTTGDKITLKDAMTADMFTNAGNTVINGSLNLVLGNFDNDLTMADANMDATTDVLYIDGTGMTSTSSELTFDGSLEAEAKFVIKGGAGNDIITAGGQNADTFTLGLGSDDVNYTNVNQFGDTITDFNSGTDDIIFNGLTGGGQLTNGTNSQTLSSITSSGQVGANTLFVEITDSTAGGGADTAAEVVAALTNLDVVTNVDQNDEIVIALNDGTDTYLWHYVENDVAADAVMAADDLTLIVKLSGVTNIADGDLASS